MQTLWTSAGLWLVQATLAGSFVLLLTLGWMRVIRQPARQQRVGEAGLAAALVAGVMALGPAWLLVPWSPFADSIAPTPVADFLVTLITDESPDELQAAAAWENPIEAPEAVAVQPTSEVRSLATPSTGLGLTFVVVLLMCYASGAAYFLCRWFVGFLRLRRILREADAAPDEIQGLFVQQEAPGQTPRLLMSRRLRVPVSCGIWRPTIVLPVSLCKPPDHGRLPWVFAHELTHVVRRDAWSSLLFALGQAVFFYLPWFWWLRRQVRLCQEFVADAAAVAQRPADEYAEFLLSLITFPAVPMAATGVSGNKSDLFRRVSMLLKNRTPVEQCCPRSWTLGAGSLLIAVAVVLGGIGLAEGGGRIIIIEPAGKTPVDVIKPVAGTQVRVQAIEKQVQDKDVIIIHDKHKTIPSTGVRVHVEGKPAPGKKAVYFEGPDKIVIHLDGLSKEVLGDLAPKLHKMIPATGKPAVYSFERATDKQKPMHNTEELLKMLEQVLGKDGEKIRKQVEDALKKATNKRFDLELKLEGLKDLKWDMKELEKWKASGFQWKFDGPDHKAWLTPLQGGAAIVGEKPRTLGVLVAPQARLGAQLTRPSDILAEQLNLPKGKGLVVSDVAADSLAAKAGLKANDLLLKANNQPVANDPVKFAKFVESLKPDETLEMVVLRRGKEHSLKSVKMPETTRGADLLKKGDLTLSTPLERTLLATTPQGATRAWSQLLSKDGVVTTTLRTGERFNTRHQEGSLIITIVGKVDDGRALPQEIHIQDGNTSNKYERADRVPAQYRDKVNHLIQISGQMRVSGESAK